jgi:hypothetical protein
MMVMMVMMMMMMIAQMPTQTLGILKMMSDLLISRLQIFHVPSAKKWDYCRIAE